MEKEVNNSDMLSEKSAFKYCDKCEKLAFIFNDFCFLFSMESFGKFRKDLASLFRCPNSRRFLENNGEIIIKDYTGENTLSLKYSDLKLLNEKMNEISLDMAAQGYTLWVGVYHLA